MPLALLSSALLFAATPTAIIVDPGPFRSAQEAAAAEEFVDWLDADQRDDDACTLCFAAMELQRVLRMMTGDGGNFQVLAPAQAPSEGDRILLRVSGDGPSESYRIDTQESDGDRTVLIEGADRVGTLYGAYDLLHRLGARWLAPGPLGEEIPLLPEGRLPVVTAQETPDFTLRGFHAWEDRGDEEFLLWMARNRMNHWCVEQSGHALMRKLGIRMEAGGHVLQSLYINPADPYPYDAANDPYTPSSESAGDANGDGVLSYAEAHPEWYALIDGVRKPDIRGDFGANYCTSNQDATAELVRGLVNDLAEGQWRDADVLNAWMLDWGAWCECEACQAQGSWTDRNLRVVHAMAEGIAEARVQGRINRPIALLFLAYADVIEPPTRPLPDDFDYDVCIATYFPIQRCYVHPLDASICETNRRYSEHLDGWAAAPERHYRGQLCIGEYYNVSRTKCLPVVFRGTMDTDVPHYYGLGARLFHYMHVTTEDWGTRALTNYQLARQLWNHDADPEGIFEDYLAARYGLAAPAMARFYGSLQTMLENVTPLKYELAPRLDSGARPLFSDPHLQYDERLPGGGPSLRAMLAAADRCQAILDSVQTQPLADRIRDRIAEDAAAFLYGRRTLQLYDAMARAYAAIDGDRPDEARAACQEALGLAESLRADTTSASFSSSHASATNALEAAGVARGLVALQWKLDLVRPAPGDVPILGAQGVTLWGDTMAGGGGPLYGHGLRIFPERRQVSLRGNYAYASPHFPADRLLGWFRMEGPPPARLLVETSGLAYPAESGGAVPLELRVNGEVVHEGPAPFGERELTPARFIVPGSVLRAGDNSIELRNVSEAGPLGGRPWFGVDSLRLSVRGE